MQMDLKYLMGSMQTSSGTLSFSSIFT